MAQAVQGTPNPPLNAFIAMIWISILFWGKRRTTFPKHLLSDGTPTNNEKTVLRELNGRYLSISKIFRKAPFFLIGYIYLLFMLLLALPFVQKMTVFGHTYASIFLPETCVCIDKSSEAKKPAEEKKTESSGDTNNKK